MALEFPESHVVALHDLAARLLDSRRSGTDLRTLARDMLAGFHELCLRAGLDGLLAELDVVDAEALAEHATLAPALAAALEAADLDGGGPRNAKPRQVADCVVTTLGLAIAAEPDRTITLGADVRAEVIAALASVADVELAVPHVRETVVALARERCSPDHAVAFNRIVAQLDDRGMQMIKQPKVALDASQAIQHALYEVRVALLDRIARAAIDRALPVIARAHPDAAVRIDRPVTLRLTPRDIAARRASDPRVPKTPAAIVEIVLGGMSSAARIAWQSPTQAARPYAATQTFGVGELVDHPKFGRGAVVGVATSRVDIEFADGKHTLVHALARK